MSAEIITQVIKEMNDLPDDLQQQVLQLIETLRQQTSSNLWQCLGCPRISPQALLKPHPIGQWYRVDSAAPQYLLESPGHEFIFSFTELDERAIATGIEKLVSIFARPQ